MAGFLGYLELENSVELEAFITSASSPQTQHVRREMVVFDSQRLLERRKNKSLRQLPSISLSEIDSKCKGDAFVKGVAIIQVL